MKYGELTLGQMEAIINKIGGMESVRRLLADELVISPPLFVNAILKRDMRKEGWKLLEHTMRCITSAADLEAVSFLRGREDYTNGEEMVRRARTELDTNYSQEDAEFLLDHQNEIPTELRPYLLVFTATIWEDSDGHRLIPCIHWNGERWGLRFDWLDGDFGSRYRLVRPRK